MYFMDDKQTLIVKRDKALGTQDPCITDFLLSGNWVQAYVNIFTKIQTTLSFTVTSILDNWVFIN